jgi:tetratricopeptide (TPR) repeat protein
MFPESPARLGKIIFSLMVLFAVCATVIAQAGGELTGGAGIFRPKNPEAKRTVRPPSRTPRPRPTANTPDPRANTAEIDEKFQNALADGNEARDARNFSLAEKSYRLALDIKPRDARAFQGLGNVLTDQRRWDEAEAAYRKAVEFAPTNPDALMALSFVLVQPRPGALNAKRFSDAELFAKRAAQLQPANPVAFDRVGAAMIARGSFNADTEAALRRALELDPNYIVAQVHLARVLRQMNRAAEADPLYAAAIEKAKDAPTLVLIAEGMQSEQRWTESEPVLKRALELDPRSPGGLYLMGRMLTVVRRYAESESYLKAAIEASPKFFEPRNILARSYLGLERWDDAFKTYESAVDLATDSDRKQLAGAFGFGGVGDGYMKANRYKDAIRAYERGLELDRLPELETKLGVARQKASPLD